MASVLTGVIVLILVLAWLFKRLGNFSPAGKGVVKIIGGVSLGPRERAVVLEAGDKRLLVGIAPGRIQTLCMLDADAGSKVSTGDAVDGDFSSRLDAQLQDDAK
jgi:flagellar protein FliO/FliZ